MENLEEKEELFDLLNYTVWTLKKEKYEGQKYIQFERVITIKKEGDESQWDERWNYIKV